MAPLKTELLVIVAVGTRGDIIPFLAVGRELVRRGRDVLIFTNSNHEIFVSDAGLGFCSIAPPNPPQSLLSRYRTFTQVDIPSFLLSARLIKILMSDKRLAGVVAHDLALGALVACAGLEIPFVEVVLSPCGLVPQALSEAASQASTGLGNSDLINMILEEIGLPPTSTSVVPFSRQARFTLALFPELLALEGTTASAQFTGFPFYDVEDELDEELEEFLGQGQDPIVVTAGTGVTNSTLFVAAAAACRTLGARGVFLSLLACPRSLEEHGRILTREYVSLAKLFPRARIIVHHGGVGTIAQALRAGVPQVIVPRMFDQPSNAAQIERLGLGHVVGSQDLCAPALVDAILKIERDGELLPRLRTMQSAMFGARSASLAADAIIQALSDSL